MSRRKIVAVVLTGLGVVAVASPASAGNEQYRLSVPDTAKAGTTITDILGSCAGDGSPSVVSDAFVGGKATIHHPDAYYWRAEAEIADRPGYHFVYLNCAGGRAMVDAVTVIS